MSLSVFAAEDNSRFSSLDECQEYLRYVRFFTDMEHQYVGIPATRVAAEIRQHAANRFARGETFTLPDGSVLLPGSPWPNGYVQHNPAVIKYLLDQVHDFKADEPNFFRACSSLWSRLLYTDWEQGREFSITKVTDLTGVQCWRTREFGLLDHSLNTET